MFSPALSDRRNEALKARKALIEENKGVDYILAYPAKLLTRKRGSKDKYTLYKEY